MEDLYEQIKSFESDKLKIKYDGCIHIYINGEYPIEFIGVLKEYGKHHHLRLRRLYNVNDGFSLDRLFIAGFADKKDRPYSFLMYC